VAVVIEASHACMSARGVEHARRDDEHQPHDGRFPRRQRSRREVLALMGY
jgi:GTP cyclohydrolase I